MKKACFIGAVATFGLLAAQTLMAGPDNDARGWLERMTTAMSQMDYQGTFVYMQGDAMETMRITHVSDEDGVHERLVSQSGAPWEILRDSNGVRWVGGDESSVLEDRSIRRSFFPVLPLAGSEQHGQSYTFKFGGKSRIAGHNSRNIKVLPRDHYRYGYSLWLEEHSGLLLKWELLGSKRQTLAKLMFTDLKLGSEVDRGELKPSGRMQKSAAVESGLPAANAGKSGQPHWRPGRLPPGFILTTHRYIEAVDDAGSKYEHLVYSDGLAAVSVYVESLGDTPAHPEITQQHGTTHAYMGTSGNMMVTVVGNVPAVTVEMVGKSVELNSP
ncbi:MAG: MucB/RseB C-terminal domain-containing protein [Xanthomonadales bacterium]|jgi:sigma-E factor negative regulatory protein RseB|nr:MucB/RseB C-terminal domain-containing protein [Xanthomonadales bacterium]